MSSGVDREEWDALGNPAGSFDVVLEMAEHNHRVLKFVPLDKPVEIVGDGSGEAVPPVAYYCGSIDTSAQGCTCAPECPDPRCEAHR